MVESDNTIWIALGIAVSILVPISIFAGNQVAKTRRDRRIKLENKLKIHFEDIKRVVDVEIGPITRTLNIHKGRLILRDYVPVAECYDFKKDESYISFEVHFPELASEWEQLEKEVLKLDNKLAELYLNIAKEFQLQGLNIVKTDTNPKNIPKVCILDDFFGVLFDYWEELGNRDQSTIFDSIETQANSSYMYASGREARLLAYGEEDKDREKCKSAIYNLLENELIKKEGFNLVDSVEKLREKRRDFARKLDNEMKDTEKYEMGREFKKLRNCPICKKF